MVAVISVDAYPCLAFSNLTYYVEDMGISLMVPLCRLIVRRPNLMTKRLLHQQVKILGTFSAMFAHGIASL